MTPITATDLARDRHRLWLELTVAAWLRDRRLKTVQTAVCGIIDRGLPPARVFTFRAGARCDEWGLPRKKADQLGACEIPASDIVYRRRAAVRNALDGMRRA